MVPDFSGDFISIDATKDGDILVILDEGKEEMSKTLGKIMFNIKVELNGKTKTWSPSNKQGKELQKAFGPDTKGWVGQKVQLIHVQGNLLIKPIIPQKVN